jgi:MFS-type transporter involved in bile tolerance (Atg22 family)
VTLSVGACMTLIVASQTNSFIWLLIFALSVGVGKICDIKMRRRAKVLANSFDSRAVRR